MTTGGIALALLSQAEVILTEADRHLAEGVAGLAVRRAQEAVELALKGVLRWAGVEVPRVHDVGATLLHHGARLQAVAGADLARLAQISQRLTRERSAAFYGEDEGERGPNELFDAEDAQGAVGDARWAVAICAQLVRETTA